MISDRTRVRGAELVWERSGEGPDLIWGHGLSMNRASDTGMGLVDWDQVPVRLLRYDARGHGESESTPDLDGYSWAELALDQIALADALGIETFVSAGASMGCGTALHVAVNVPERVERLVLAIPPTGWETRAAQADQWEQSATIIETRGVEMLIAARAEMAPPDPYVGDDERRERQADWTRSWDPARLAHVMRGATRANLPERDAIAMITAPTLILAWTGDPIHPVTTADELARLLPHADVHIASTAAELATWTDRIASFITAG